MAKTTIFTIGHSDLSIEAFIDALQRNGVKMVVDVRKLTGSDAFPQFDEDQLGPSLEHAGIKYRIEPLLAGRRPRNYTIDPTTNAVWTNQSFHNYADYATTAPFDRGLARLEKRGRDQPTTVMCSEAVWWRCHRRIIADHLLAQGYVVQHIMDGGTLEKAALTPGAVVAHGSVTYPKDR